MYQHLTIDYMYMCSTFLSIFFLHHQGQIVYSVIGDLQTPFYFDVNSRSGIVTIKNSLIQDNAQTYIVCTTYLLDTCILVYHFTPTFLGSLTTIEFAQYGYVVTAEGDSL